MKPLNDTWSIHPQGNMGHGIYKAAQEAADGKPVIMGVSEAQEELGKLAQQMIARENKKDEWS